MQHQSRVCVFCFGFVVANLLANIVQLSVGHHKQMLKCMHMMQSIPNIIYDYRNMKLESIVLKCVVGEF